jgi:uncharacterized membrane protein YhdT
MNHIEENKNCYSFEEKKYDHGFLDDSVDATYIIHLQGNDERYKNITKQLEIYHPTKKVFLLLNKGYKNCNKVLNEQTPKCDLIDAFYQVFNHANKHQYNNILILEDDFIFNEKISDSKINGINDINEFIKNRTSLQQNFIYSLGTIPYLQIPLLNKHSVLLLSTGTHASIYSKKCIETILSLIQDSISDWDLHVNFGLFGKTTRYLYHEPLCYQLFSETENFESWSCIFGLKYILMWIFKMLNMNNQAEPGFSIFYNFSKILYFILYFCLIYVLYKIFTNVKNFFI